MAFKTEIHQTDKHDHRVDPRLSLAQLNNEADAMLGPCKTLNQEEREQAEHIYQQMDAIWQSVIDSAGEHISDRVIEDFLASSQYPVMQELEDSLQRLYELQPFTGLSQAQYQWIKALNILLDELNNETRCRLTTANTKQHNRGQRDCSPSKFTAVHSIYKYSH
ncbi:hypothetical protein [uncultured Pseudoteredinibacter sp.]|uniref:hypothetical protein n=1 Tax=uncultured Pseudoteredinibacter sp. TaxID=1641701 RepID=UPI002612FF64|nr:hypothetical protein [uncultured Pseudoteredinibacter sp.]